MTTDVLKGNAIRIDPTAASTSPTEPAFVARPEGAPIYHGFAVLNDSLTDGWLLGVISDPNGTHAKDYLDGFVIAPDGSRAGVVWDTNVAQIEQIVAPDAARWGVYSVPMRADVHSDADLIREFRRVLPDLKELHHRHVA